MSPHTTFQSLQHHGGEIVKMFILDGCYPVNPSNRGRVEALESEAKRAQVTAAAALAVAGGGGQPAFNTFPQSSGAIGLNALIWSDAPTTVATAPVATPHLAVLGPALEAVGPGVPVRAARPGQVVTMVSDGAGVLNNGDYVRASTTVAGRIEFIANVPGNLVVGRVIVGALAVPGAPVQVWFVPGVV